MSAPRRTIITAHHARNGVDQIIGLPLSGAMGAILWTRNHDDTITIDCFAADHESLGDLITDLTLQADEVFNQEMTGELTVQIERLGLRFILTVAEASVAEDAALLTAGEQGNTDL